VGRSTKRATRWRKPA